MDIAGTIHPVFMPAGHCTNQQTRGIPMRNLVAVLSSIPARRRITLLAIGVLLVVGALLFATWRIWPPSPRLLHYSHANFDAFQIYGHAPWCFLYNSTDNSVDCHYLSENHCQLANASLIAKNKLEDRGLCVPNPLNSRAAEGRAPTVAATP